MSGLQSAFLTRPLAHRGLHDRASGVIENTRAAFEAAIEAGYGIELDVQMSSDGVAMVFHDDELDRLTAETGLVRMRTAEELSGIGLSGGQDRIETLTDILALIGDRAPVLIEIKDQSAHEGADIAALDQVVGWVTQNAVRDHGCIAAIMSFNPAYVASLKWLPPEIPRGLTGMVFEEPDLPAEVNAALTDYAAFESAGCSFISHDRRTLDTAPVHRLKDQGVPILCWTVRSEEEEAVARKVADNITFEGYSAALPG